MGFSYLKDNYWVDITREERFFCALAYNYFSKDPKNSVKYIINKAKLQKYEDIIDQEWEIGYEVALYRDLFHSLGKCLNNEKDSYRKKPFDLCCFSEETIIIIEAKAHGGFATEQLESFKDDRKNIPRVIEKNINIKIVSLISNKYQHRNTTLAYFDGKPITWLELENKYDEPLFNKANKAYRKYVPI